MKCVLLLIILFSMSCTKMTELFNSSDPLPVNSKKDERENFKDSADPVGGITSFFFATAAASESDLPECNTGMIGKIYYVTTGRVFKACTSGGWEAIDVRGPQGDKGDTGATGATGARGEKGDTGSNGSTGSSGTSVSTATVNGLGELVLTMSDASIVNAGVVKGEKGDTGPSGTSSGGAGYFYDGIRRGNMSFDYYTRITPYYGSLSEYAAYELKGIAKVYEGDEGFRFPVKFLEYSSDFGFGNAFFSKGRIVKVMYMGKNSGNGVHLADDCDFAWTVSYGWCPPYDGCIYTMSNCSGSCYWLNVPDSGSIIKKRNSSGEFVYYHTGDLLETVAIRHNQSGYRFDESGACIEVIAESDTNPQAGSSGEISRYSFEMTELTPEQFEYLSNLEEGF